MVARPSVVDDDDNSLSRQQKADVGPCAKGAVDPLA
jgi:hypothetical protein